MIPKNIEKYFIEDRIITNKTDSFVSGSLKCCDNEAFEIYYYGKINKIKILNKLYLSPKNGLIEVELQCKNCRKRIHVFNNTCDGYNSIIGFNEKKEAKLEALHCQNCNNNDFSVHVGYEYSDTQELKEFGLYNIDNSFTYIWLTIKCNNCGKNYHNFIEYDNT